MEKLLNVLIIEDDEKIAELESSYLSSISNDVFIAYTMKEALKIIDKEDDKIDIIVLDLNLPDSKEIDSFFLIKQKVRKIPIIVVSGISIESIAIDAVSRGAQDYIVKEYLNEYVLIKSIRYALERHSIFLAMDTMVEQKTKEIAMASKFSFELAKAVTWILENDILDNEVDYLLRKFGSILEADRMTVLKLQGTENSVNIQDYEEACNYGITDFWQKDTVETCEFEDLNFPCFDDRNYDMNWWHKALVDRKIKHILPKDTTGPTVNRLIVKYGSKSIIVVPIYLADATPWGLLVCEQCNYERHWTELEIRNLGILAPLISLVYERNEKNKRLGELSKRADNVLLDLQEQHSKFKGLNEEMREHERTR